VRVRVGGGLCRIGGSEAGEAGRMERAVEAWDRILVIVCGGEGSFRECLVWCSRVMVRLQLSAGGCSAVRGRGGGDVVVVVVGLVLVLLPLHA